MGVDDKTENSRSTGPAITGNISAIYNLVQSMQPFPATF